jgi:predicted outer membrane repeat protein
MRLASSFAPHAGGMLAAACLSFATPTPAAVRVVTNLNDGGAGSLRQTITDSAAEDVVTFDPSLTAGGYADMVPATEIVINHNLTLRGPGRSRLGISGGGTHRVFSVDASSSVTFSGLRIHDGSAAFGAGITDMGGYAVVTLLSCLIDYNVSSGGVVPDGGGVRTNSLVAADTEFSHNYTTGRGGAIFGLWGGSVGLTRCVLVNNSAEGDGGAIYSTGAYTLLQDCTVQDNSAGLYGGGLFCDEGAPLIVGSTFGGNSADCGGAAFLRPSGTPFGFVTNTTISGNSSTGDGAGLFLGHRTGAQPLYVTHATIANNTSNSDNDSGGAGALAVAAHEGATGAAVVLSHTIIAGNTNYPSGQYPDLCVVENPPPYNPVSSSGYNLIGSAGADTQFPFSANTTGDKYGDPFNTTIQNAGAFESPTAINPSLGLLQFNQGPTRTHSPNAGSLAIDGGNPIAMVGIDQCGRPRPVGAATDIGAVEVRPFRVEMADFCARDLYPVGGITGWCTFGNQYFLTWTDYSADETAYRAHIVNDGSHYRVTGAMTNPDLWIRNSWIGTDKLLRAKYFVYAAGQPNPGQVIQIPNMRVRLSVRFAQNSMLEVFGHQNADPAIQPCAGELAPSQDPANPSVYRVDLAPVFVPYFNDTSGEGVLRAFEAWSTDPQDHGYLGLAESVIGTYPASLVSPGLTPPLKVYEPSGGGAGNLGLTEPEASNLMYSVLIPAGQGVFPTADFGVAPNYLEHVAGVTFNSVWFDNTLGGTRVGIISREFGPGANLAQRVRVEPGKQYHVRFHATGTQQSNRQPQIRFRARSVKFSWVQKLELGGAWATNGVQNSTLAAQMLPGVGCLNPDKAGAEAGGWYTLVMHTPMEMDIRRDRGGFFSLAERMPQLSAQPGPGFDVPSYRDLKVGADLLDTISFGPNAPLEAGDFTIDRIEVRGYNLVAD